MNKRTFTFPPFWRIAVALLLGTVYGGVAYTAARFGSLAVSGELSGTPRFPLDDAPVWFLAAGILADGIAALLFVMPIYQEFRRANRGRRDDAADSPSAH